MRATRALRLAVCALALACASPLFAEPGDNWSRANEEFAAGHFREAIDLYEGLVRSGDMGAPVFYNIGNAQYRLGDLGAAILNYERALALEPHHPEAEANLRLVRDKARALELKRNSFDRILARATPTHYSLAAAIGFWLAAFALGGIFLSRRRSGARVGLALLGLLTCAAASAALYLREKGADGGALAIVTAKSTEARLATADNAGTVLVLPAGSEVKILSTRGDWSYAALPNDLRGWIPAKSAERVRL